MFIFVWCASFLVTGCAPTKEVVRVETKIESHTDTVYFEKHDTLYKSSVKVERDTVIEKHIYTYYLTSQGDTAKAIESHDTYHGSASNDSLDYYKSIADHYKEIAESKSNADKYVEKARKEDILGGIKDLLFYAFILAILATIFIFVWKIKKD